MVYGERSNGSLHGTVYTSPQVVEFILDLCNESSPQLSGKVIVDPAVGDGAFLIPVLKRLVKENGSDSAALKAALRRVHVFELDAAIIPILKTRALQVLQSQSDLDCINIVVGDFLLADAPNADIIIGNPPYVRYDNIPEPARGMYKQLYSTFVNRADIYVAFIEKSLRLLKPNGVLSFICADRWLNNQYGRVLRAIIHQEFNLKYFLKFKGYNPFEEEVIAYPSIFLIQRTEPKNAIRFHEIATADEMGLESLSTSNVTYKFGDNSTIAYDSHDEYLFGLEAQGFKIGIGVATGSDKAFIVDDIDTVEHELLVPLVRREDFVDGKIQWKGRYLINTYSKTGKGVVNLNDYPKLRTHLSRFESKLRERYVSNRTGHWYRLIDGVDESLTGKPKLFIPDITTKRSVIFDSGRYYPHHNLYYIASPNVDDLLVLRAILMSDFTQDQVRQKGVLMNGGALRWQAQTLRKLSLPLISSLSPSEREKLKFASNPLDLENLNSLMSSIVQEAHQSLERK